MKNKFIYYFKLVLKNISNPELLAGMVISITVVAVTFNTSSVIMQNYTLERDVKVAEQKVAIAQDELYTQKLKNNYYKTDAFLDIAARKQLSKGLPGEKLIIVPKSVALKYVHVDSIATAKTLGDNASLNRSNIQKWGHFLTGNLD